MNKVIRNIKDRMENYKAKKLKQITCPNCNGKMILNEKNGFFECQNCNYRLSREMFLNDYIFYFCDNCGAYLNNQEGFNYNNKYNVCTYCGYNNITDETNLVSICKYCGKIIDDPEQDVCDECKEKRRDTLIEILEESQKMTNDLANAIDSNSNISVISENLDLLSSNTEFSYVDDYWVNNASSYQIEEVVHEIENYINQLNDYTIEKSNLNDLVDKLKEFYHLKFNNYIY